MKKTILAATFLLCLFAGNSKSISPLTDVSQLSVIRKDGKALIQWTAPESANIAMFELESSKDGKTFKTIAYILTAETIKNYSYRDKISDNNTYYRLKQIDHVGQASYTTVQVLKSTNQTQDVKIAATNNGKVYIEFNQKLNKNFVVTLSTLNGETIAQYDYQQATKKVIFNAPDHIKTFIVTVTTPTNLNISKQIVL
jgi:hypothetical protein